MPLITSTAFGQTGGGVAVVGLVIGGFNTGAAANVANNDLYTFATDTAASTTASTIIRGENQVISDATAARILGTNPTDKYTYADASVVAGGNLPSGRSSASQCCNSTVGIIGFGNSGGVVNTSDKYTFASDTAAAGTTFSGTARTSVSSDSSTTIGYVFAGRPVGTVTAIVDKYTYAGDSVSAGTSLSTAKRDPRAAGTGLLSIIASGATDPGAGTIVATSEKYTYAGDVVGGATSLANPHWSGAAMSDKTIGRYCMGLDAGFAEVTNTNNYTFAGDTIGAGGTFAAPIRRNTNGTSDVHGGL